MVGFVEPNAISCMALLLNMGENSFIAYHIYKAVLICFSAFSTDVPVGASS